MSGEKLAAGLARVNVSEFPYWGHFRAFKIKGGYLCGVCRKSYVEEVQAKTCVINCTLPYAEYNVDTLVRGMKTRYRCPFCYREYLDNDNAKSCLARCKKHIFSETGSDPYLEAAKRDAANVKGKVLSAVSSAPRRENVLNGRGDRASSSAASDFLENHETKAPLRAVSGGAAPAASAAKSAKPAVAAAAPAAANAKKEEPPKEKYDPNVIYREEGQKPFSRADARYVCSACSTKYFTKTEVEQCFNSHPLKPDV